MDAEGTRLGSRALFYSSCISLVANFVLPLFVVKPQLDQGIAGLMSGVGTLELVMRKLRVGLPMLWAISHALFAMCMFATLYVCAEGVLHHSDRASLASFRVCQAQVCWSQ